MITLLALLLGSQAQAAELVDGVACVVNDEIITLSELYEVGGEFVAQRCGGVTPGIRDACTDAAEQEVAGTLILQALVRQKLIDAAMDVAEADLERTIEQIMRDNGISNIDDFKAALRQQGFTWGAYRAQLRDQVRMLRFRETFLRPQITLDEQDVIDAYRRAVAEQPQEETLTITYAAFSIPNAGDSASALTFKAELMEALKSEGFDGLNAVGEMAARKGSSSYTPSQLVEALRPIMQLELGGVGGPYRLGDSYFLVRLESREAPEIPALEQVRSQVEGQLYEQRMEEAAEIWYRTARRGAAVQCTFGTPE